MKIIENEPVLKLFFALWPKGDTMAQLSKNTRQLEKVLGGRAVTDTSLHLTLKYLGEFPVTRLHPLVDGVKDISTPAFQLNLNQTGVWTGPQIVWQAPESIPDPLFDLHGQLESLCRKQGLPPETRPFQPHVTLLKKYPGNAESLPALANVLFDVDAFMLAQSLSTAEGVKYEVCYRWRLLE